MLIDKTFFTGDIFVPNLNEKCDNLHFFEWIERWEEQCLRIVLGDCLYEEFMAQFEWDDISEKYVLIEGADEKWDWLLNGHSYTEDDISERSTFKFLGCDCGCNQMNCKNLYWGGLLKVKQRRIPSINIGGQSANAIMIKSSLIAYYVYWLWCLRTDSFTSSTGEQVADVKNATRISNEHQRIDAHNKFVSMVQGCERSGTVGLYRFLQDFQNLYPEWGGKCLSYEPIW